MPWVGTSVPGASGGRPCPADVASLTAFEAGLFGWIALMTFVFFPAPHLTPASPVYRLLMQVGVIAGSSSPGRSPPG